MSWYGNYVDYFSQDNKDYYEEMTQEWVNDYFDDSTLVDVIKEEQYPFNNKYCEHIVHIDSVSEISVNINKVIGDYISVMFKDCQHRNYRGQKYLWNGETYLCYDKINNLSKVATTKLIRCNNQISWINKENGKILTEKVFLGYELTSTNNQVAKSATIENRRLVLYVQGNENTKDISINQRFMFEHNQCFKVEEIDNYNQEQGVGKATLIKIYVAYSPMLPSDNMELNICNYYDTEYNIDVDQTNIQQIKGFEGKINAVVIDKNDDIIDMPLNWTTSNDKIVSVDSNGNYSVNGENGEMAVITVSLENNKDIYKTIEISVVEDYLPERTIIVNPNDITELSELESVELKCGVYIEGEKQSINVECTPSGVSQSHYKIVETIEGYEITNLSKSKQPLVLTFSAEDCDDYIMTIKLKSLL